MDRTLDIILSFVALVFLSPLLVPVVVLLRLTGEGEVLFLQERVGKNGKTFNLLKFATMLKDSPNIGTRTLTVRGDPRILPVGHFLRKTKINELPQLVNILRGDMSVIGPRPLTPAQFEHYSASTQDGVKQVRPGLSGIGSIVFREEENIMHGQAASVEYYAQVIAPYKGALEEWFVSNKSLSVYLMAILVTVWVVVVPNSKVVWSAFRGLPEPPTELQESLNYCSTFELP